MIEMIPVTEDLLPEVQKIAFNTWPSTFKGILTPEQLEYMLNRMYNIAELRSLMVEKSHHYILAREEGSYLGFCSIEHHCGSSSKTKVHRIYILPEAQGKGVGKKFIRYASDQAKAQQDNKLFLNVNKFNAAAIEFYERAGFRKVKEEVIDIGNGYVMDDYVMEVDLE